MISHAYRTLRLMSTRLYKPVAFMRKSRTTQPINAVAIKVESSIVMDHFPLIRWDISAILLSKFSKYCSGSSVSLVFYKAWTSA